MTIIQTTKELQPRHPKDFYQTPIEVCRKSLKVLPESFKPYSILDPGAGTGVWGEAAIEKYPNADVVGVEIRQEQSRNINYDLWIKQDYLDWDSHHYFSLIIGNPPYSLAESFIRKNLDELVYGGYLLLLLRLNFLEGKKRAKGLYKEFPPKEVHIVGRVSFSGNNRTDDTPYALFLWQQGYYEQTTVKWLEQMESK